MRYVLAIFGLVAATGLVRCTCEPEPVVPLDDDAGVADAGEHDAGQPDAGQPDAGLADAGVVDAGSLPDAGPACDWGDNPPIPFTCEGDEDWCDPLGDTPDPEGDLLAVWSRVEGDDLIIQMRFSAPPFRNIIEEEPLIAFSQAQGVVAAGQQDDPFGLCENNFLPFAHFCIPANSGFALDFNRDSTEAAERGYPPQGPSINPPQLTGQAALDRCSFRLGRDSPILEAHVPYSFFSRTDGSVRYGINVDGIDVAGPLDFTWISGAPQLITSLGGRADDDSDLVSFCDLTCPTAGP